MAPCSTRRERHGDAVAGIVLHAIGVGHAAAQALTLDDRDELCHRVRAEVVGTSAIARSTEQVIEREPGTHEGSVHERPAVDREEEAFQLDQVGSDLQQPRALGQGFAHQLQAQVLEVAQAAVDQPRRA